jgi:VIT1/CCC1 family predicted Fe2+/Mn2+ transporter
MEATEKEVYHRLAKQQKDPLNAAILEGIALEEERHESIIAEMTGETVNPAMFRVWLQVILAKFLGLTFSVKMMEKIERDVSAEYRKLGLHDIADEEDAHEEKLIEMLEEDALLYLGSVILGLSDALVELTGALAGLTFAFQSLNLVALAGLVTGIAASFSMAASEYLSTKEESDGRSPFKAAGFTGISYIITVFLLVMPYLLLQADDPFRYGLAPHVQALGCTLAIGFTIIATFNGYVAIAQDEPFGKRFVEMAGILIVVSVISFVIGIALRSWFGVEI